MYIDYFTAGERERFLFTSCEETQSKTGHQSTSGAGFIVFVAAFLSNRNDKLSDVRFQLLRENFFYNPLVSIRNSLSKATLCWVLFLVFSFSWSSINPCTELMSAYLKSMILIKQGTLQTFALIYFAWPPPKTGKADTNFLTRDQSRIRLLIGHTIFFTTEKKLFLYVCRRDDNGAQW